MAKLETRLENSQIQLYIVVYRHLYLLNQSIFNTPMRHRITSFFTILRKPKVFILLAIIIALAGFMLYRSSSTSNIQSFKVQSSTFVQEVAVTGKVVAAKDVSMGFEQAGRVSKVNVAVGDKVYTGQTLASLQSGDVYASILQRQAQVDVETAKLAQVQRGSRLEDITLAQSDVDGAQSTVSQSLQSLVDTIKDSLSKSDDAIRSRVDQLYKNPRSVTPEVVAFDNYALRQSVNDQRLQVGEMLTAWQSSISSLTPSSMNDSYVIETRAHLNQVRNILNDLSNGLSSLQANGAITQTTIDKYKNDISTALSNISQAISALSSADQNNRLAKSALERAQQTLTLKKNGSTQEDIATQAAQLKSAQAQLESANASYMKTVIRAPFSGLITKADIKAGEIASPNTPVISVISESQYEMESYVSENDIAKVKVGQTAKVTLDSYGKDIVFDAQVVEVDPAETIQSGVTTYKTKLQFKQADSRIKSGMTANITITTAETPATIVVPQEAVFLEAGEKVVTVLSDGKKTNKRVVTGGINTDGNIEIVSGLSVGDTIIITH